MPTDRTDPPLVAKEPMMLRAWLDFHRDTLRLKTEGLTHDQLTARLAPSTLTLGQLLKHMALVESSWFSRVLVGEPMMPPFDTAPFDDDVDWEMTSSAQDSPEQLRSLFDEAVARSDAIIEQALEGEGLDMLSSRPSRHSGEPFSLRWIMLHMIEEYARHNGHADLIRESVDGQTGE